LTVQKILKKTAGWGEVHVNSNIEGGKLKIDGKEYEKGIATHANSILIFDIPEDAVSFSALAGIDNTGSDQGSKSSVEFLVFNYDPTFRAEYTDQWNGGNVLVAVDPTKQIAESGYMCREGETKTAELQADIKGAEKLYLVVTDGGDNLSYDHADWVDPVLVKADGSEVSLTTIAWDSNPINGWNAPKINRNNDGNKLKVDGVEYDYGFGVNAPSILTFTLPENHDFVAFRCKAGLDNDVDNAPFGATVEFRVFTEDPAPNNDANVTLDLASIGLNAGQKAKITEMWSGTEEGTFADSEFAPFLREHASGLYRITPQGRVDSASLGLSAEEDEETGVMTLKAVLVGGSVENAYVQFVRDGEILGSTKIADDGSAVMTIPSVSGKHTYKAFYSGNAEVTNAVSNEITHESAGVDSISADQKDCEIVPRKGGIEVVNASVHNLDIYSTSGEKVKTVKTDNLPLFVSLDPGFYLIANQKFLID
ncbi:MAG: NPCBM/NEW2 domain-containing protein, partial [Muribaculaceae bacterium]|nr:NPCBM/NEW2 domain-containing protein [Muribaculaceae bacterium]